MTYLSERMLYDYITCGLHSFADVKSVLHSDYIDNGMDSLRYSYNLRLLYTHSDNYFC